MEGTGDEMAEHQQRPQCLVGDCGFPTDMAVLSRCPAYDDGYSVAGDDAQWGMDDEQIQWVVAMRVNTNMLNESPEQLQQ